jgi:hypothetical protein
MYTLCRLTKASSSKRQATSLPQLSDKLQATERKNMSAIKKKSETCGEQLRRMCKRIADDISDNDGTTASEWMEGTYDIRYTVDREKRYLGAELLVAGGGPNIWVNTYTKYVEGYWWGDKVLEPFIDNLGLDDYCEEMYGC